MDNEKMYIVAVYFVTSAPSAPLLLLLIADFPQLASLVLLHLFEFLALLQPIHSFRQT